MIIDVLLGFHDIEMKTHSIFDLNVIMNCVVRS